MCAQLRRLLDDEVHLLPLGHRLRQRDLQRRLDPATVEPLVEGRADRAAVDVERRGERAPA